MGLAQIFGLVELFFLLCSLEVEIISPLDSSAFFVYAIIFQLSTRDCSKFFFSSQFLTLLIHLSSFIYPVKFTQSYHLKTIICEVYSKRFDRGSSCILNMSLKELDVCLKFFLFLYVMIEVKPLKWLKILLSISFLLLFIGIISGMLVPDVMKRSSIEEIMEDPWFRMYVSLLFSVFLVVLSLLSSLPPLFFLYLMYCVWCGRE